MIITMIVLSMIKKFLNFLPFMFIGIYSMAMDICSAADIDDKPWRSLDLNRTVLLTLPQGKVVIELTPQFAPKHVEQFTALVQKSFYNGTRFYRVIDGFVAQAGPKNGSVKDKSVPLLAMEGIFSLGKNIPFTAVQSNDLFAKKTGFNSGFALASDNDDSAWLSHCPGTIAMARSNEANSASSHFYIVIGQAPRYLDKIMTIFGRVVYGMEHIQAIKRTAVIAGEAAVANRKHTPIVSMKLMTDVPVKDRIIIEVENTESSGFAERLAVRRERKGAFFYETPPPVLDVCQVSIRSRLIN